MNSVLTRSLVALSCLTLLACGRNRNEQLSTSNRVVEHLLSDVERLNPYNSTDANATYIEEQVFDRLLRINPETMEYNIPWLAESLPVESEDHLQFDFTLRKDVKFADGKPLTGHDVIFSLKALKNPFNIQSAQKRVYVDNIHSAEFIDGDQYKIRFKLWKPYFLIKQAAFGDVLYILPKHVFDPNNITDRYSWDDIAAIIETGNAEDLDSAKLSRTRANPAMKEQADFLNRSEYNRDAKYLFGSGPYRVDAWRTNEYVRLVRNPHYVNHWGKWGEAHPDTLIYKTINDNNAAVTALKSKDIDVMGFVQPALYAKQLDTASLHGVAKKNISLPAFSVLGWNIRNPLFKDVAVRWAMAHMVDRPTIIKTVLHGLGRITQSPVHYSKKEFNADLPEIKYDPERAKAILDSLDWKDHDGDGVRDKTIDGKSVPFAFTFIVNQGNETRRQILLVVSEALRKIGISAEVQPLEWSVFLQRLRDHDYAARFGSWQQDPYEADNFQLYHSSQGTNRGSNYESYASSRADRLMEAVRAEMDEAKRIVLQKELQRVFYEEQPNTFLWVPDNPVAWVDRFDNVTWNSVRPGFNMAWWKVRGAKTQAAQVAAGF